MIVGVEQQAHAMFSSKFIAWFSMGPVSVVEWSVARHPHPFTFRNQIVTADPKRFLIGLIENNNPILYFVDK